MVDLAAVPSIPDPAGGFAVVGTARVIDVAGFSARHRRHSGRRIRSGASVCDEALSPLPPLVRFAS